MGPRMGSKIKAGDLVQSNLFRSNGSGGYGLVMRQCDMPKFWNIWWVGHMSDDHLEVAEGGIHDIHEDDIVVVSAGTQKKTKE